MLFAPQTLAAAKALHLGIDIVFNGMGTSEKAWFLAFPIQNHQVQ